MRPATGVVRDRETAQELDDVARWLADRDAAGRREIEAWMVRQESLTTDVLAQLWSDRAWAESLRGVVVETVDGHDAPAGSEDAVVRGFLEGVSVGRGVAVLQLDGTTRWVTRRRWTVPHPVLISELDAWRVAAREAGVLQAVPQLERTWAVRDPRVHGDTDTVAVLRDVPAADPSTDLRLPLWESGALVCAHLHGSGDHATLTFTDADDRTLRLAAVGPIAWSEAVRAARLHDPSRRMRP
jgi:hypothetical protein